MAFELPDYSYGVADSAIEILEYLLRNGTDTPSHALSHVAAAIHELSEYKGEIVELVLH